MTASYLQVNAGPAANGAIRDAQLAYREGGWRTWVVPFLGGSSSVFWTIFAVHPESGATDPTGSGNESGGGAKL